MKSEAKENKQRLDHALKCLFTDLHNNVDTAEDDLVNMPIEKKGCFFI